MLYIVEGNNAFRRYFEKMGADALSKMYIQEAMGRLGCSKSIWVWDGKHSKDARLKLFPEYKGGRNKASDEFHQTTNTFKELLRYSQALQVEIEGFEADDVINWLVENSVSQITIDSTDLDFSSLISGRVKYAKEPKTQLAANDAILYKTLVGDKSDNIKGLKGFADGRFTQLSDEGKAYLLSDLMTDAPMPEDNLVGFKGKLLENYNASKPQLRIYKQVVEFIDVPDELIAANMIHGKYNPQAAQKIFDELALPMAG